MAAVSFIEPDSFKVTGDGYEIRLRLQWYRSLPLSCIDIVQVSLDGQPVDLANVRLGLNNRLYNPAEMPEMVEEFWFVQDPAHLTVLQPGAVKRGETHTIGVELTARYPYIPIGPNKSLTGVNKASVTQAAG